MATLQELESEVKREEMRVKNREEMDQIQKRRMELSRRLKLLKSKRSGVGFKGAMKSIGRGAKEIGKGTVRAVDQTLGGIEKAGKRFSPSGQKFDVIGGSFGGGKKKKRQYDPFGW